MLAQMVHRPVGYMRAVLRRRSLKNKGPYRHLKEVSTQTYCAGSCGVMKTLPYSQRVEYFSLVSESGVQKTPFSEIAFGHVLLFVSLYYYIQTSFRTNILSANSPPELQNHFS